MESSNNNAGPVQKIACPHCGIQITQPVASVTSTHEPASTDQATTTLPDPAPGRATKTMATTTMQTMTPSTVNSPANQPDSARPAQEVTHPTAPITATDKPAPADQAMVTLPDQVIEKATKAVVGEAMKAIQPLLEKVRESMQSLEAGTQSTSQLDYERQLQRMQMIGQELLKQKVEAKLQQMQMQVAKTL